MPHRGKNSALFLQTSPRILLIIGQPAPAGVSVMALESSAMRAAWVASAGATVILLLTLLVFLVFHV
jgi:hypothetical protein